MQSIVDELKAKNIHFSLMYYGKEDYGTFWDIKSILENIFKIDLVHTRFRVLNQSVII